MPASQNKIDILDAVSVFVWGGGSSLGLFDQQIPHGSSTNCRPTHRRNLHSVNCFFDSPECHPHPLKTNHQLCPRIDSLRSVMSQTHFFFFFAFQHARLVDKTTRAQLKTNTIQQRETENTCRSFPIARFENSTRRLSFSSISCLSHCDSEMRKDVTAGISAGVTRIRAPSN